MLNPEATTGSQGMKRARGRDYDNTNRSNDPLAEVGKDKRKLEPGGSLEGKGGYPLGVSYLCTAGERVEGCRDPAIVTAHGTTAGVNQGNYMCDVMGAVQGVWGPGPAVGAKARHGVADLQRM